MAQILVFLLTFTLSWVSFVSGMEHDVPEIVNIDEVLSIISLPIGFNNTSGTDCFMNASLQCLLNLPTFQSTIEESQPQGILTTLTNNLINLIKRRKESDSSTPLDPFGIDARHHIFQRYNNQEDAGEFVIGLINCILASVNKTKTQTILESLLTSTLYSTRTCKNCNHASTNSEPTESVFKVEIPQSNVTLTNCLAQFFAPELLTGREQAQCKECKNKQDSIKKFTVLQSAQHLIIQAKAFTFNRGNNKSVKNSTKIPFPLTQFSLNQYRHQDLISDCTYNLSSFVMHRGTLESGHYIAFIKQQDQNWYLCNDDKTSWVSKEGIQKIATEGYYNDSSSSENFTPFLWFYSKQNVTPVEPFHEREESINNQPNRCSSEDLIEINKKFNLVSKKMLSLNSFIPEDFFKLVYFGLYQSALEIKMLPEEITKLFNTYKIPLPTNYITLHTEPDLLQRQAESSPLLFNNDQINFENSEVPLDELENIYQEETRSHQEINNAPEINNGRVTELQSTNNFDDNFTDLGAPASPHTNNSDNTLQNLDSQRREISYREPLPEEIVLPEVVLPVKNFCQECKTGFKNEWALNRHKNTKSHKKNIKKTFPCKWRHCIHEQQPDFKNEKNLYLHTVEAHEKLSLEKHCMIGDCQKNFKKASEFNRHLRSETGYAEYACIHCKKLHILESNKNKHEKTCKKK